VATFLHEDLLFNVADWPERFWLGAGHLSIQPMTAMIFLFWFARLGVDLGGRPMRYALLAYPLFSLGSVLSTFTPLPWPEWIILLPAVASIFLSCALLVSLAGGWRRIPAWELVVLGLAIFCFSIMGGITGLAVFHSPIYRGMAANSLLMPAHFHPLVAGAATLTMLSAITPGQPEKRKRYFQSLAAFGLGAIVLSFGLTFAGHALWPRRTAWFDEQHAWPLLLMILGAFVAVFSAWVAIFHLRGGARLSLCPQAAIDARRSFLIPAIAVGVWLALLAVFFWMY
jgi:hypothetical protein